MACSLISCFSYPIKLKTFYILSLICGKTDSILVSLDSRSLYLLVSIVTLSDKSTFGSCLPFLFSDAGGKTGKPRGLIYPGLDFIPLPSVVC